MKKVAEKSPEDIKRAAELKELKDANTKRQRALAALKRTMDSTKEYLEKNDGLITKLVGQKGVPAGDCTALWLAGPEDAETC